MQPETTIFYDVDTQRDFLLPGGALYVEGANRIIPALAEMTSIARHNNIRIVCSVDRHFAEDPELKHNGGQYDDHCMDGTTGQKKIPETEPLNPLYIPNHPLSPGEIQAALAHKGEIVFEKQEFDVFIGNRHAQAVLRMLLEPYRDVVVYGVYTEVCVARAVEGLAKLGPKLTIVTDAIADLGAGAASIRQRWQQAGIRLATVAEIKKLLPA
ncbi:MAG TPA: cysteine hydrolase family protein [Candidatus Binataceae bacterium]|nr:cysteine hydrolase family protein [Candidatus Binataceae bacterium]